MLSLQHLQQRGNPNDTISAEQCDLLNESVSVQSSERVDATLDAAVIITCHNHWAYTKDAIDSLNQSKWHVVVVDDNSTDDTPHQLQNHLSRRHNFHVVSLTINMGLTAAWNAGVDFVLRHLQTNTVFLSNNDVIFAPQSLSRMIQHLRENSDISMIGPLTNAPGHQPSQQVQYHLPAYQPSHLPGHIADTSKKLTGNCLQTIPWINGFCMGFRTAFLENAYYFAQKDRTLYFNPALKDYGNEDDFQRHHADGMIAIATDAFVFHYKDITLKSNASEWTTVYRAT